MKKKILLVKSLNIFLGVGRCRSTTNDGKKTSGLISSLKREDEISRHDIHPYESEEEVIFIKGNQFCY